MSSSTAIEFGLISTLKTNHVLFDAMLCMLVPLLIQRVMAAMQNSEKTLWMVLYGWFYRSKETKCVIRTIEFKKKFNRYGSIWDGEQKTHLLQKAIAMLLADELDLRNKSARCELIDKPKKKKVKHVTKSLDDEPEREDDARSDHGDCDDNEQEPLTEVERLSIEALPPIGEWIRVNDAIEFMHELVTPENPGDDGKSVKETTVKYTFRSDQRDGSRRIDAWIREAFERYRALERAKYKKDTSRYFYIQSGSKTSQSDSSQEVVAYKRYALGEAKTFENLFFDEKDHVLQLLDHFTNKTGKFAIRGFPYKLGFLLHGPPGTGKTSLIKAIAQHTKRHIVTINLAKIKTNQDLLDAVFDLKFAVDGQDLPISMSFEDVVFVMEDIDCASRVVDKRDKRSTMSPMETKQDARASKMVESQKKAAMIDKLEEDDDDDEIPSLIGPALKPKETDKLNLSGLLNVLDGVIDCPGRIVIMTTNHPEKLDPALIRPGRVNKKLLLTHMNSTQAHKMIEYYCLATLSASQRARLDAIFECACKPFTPAEIEEHCAESDNIESVLDAIERHAQERDEL